MVTLQSGRIHMFLKLFSYVFAFEKTCGFHNKHFKSLKPILIQLKNEVVSSKNRYIFDINMVFNCLSTFVRFPFQRIFPDCTFR